MAIIIETIMVRDGQLKPTDAQKKTAEQRNSPDAKPTDIGYSHPIGGPRYSMRFIWRSTLSGKTSNGCTFSSVSAAQSAGETHEKSIAVRLDSKRLKRFGKSLKKFA